VKLLLQSGFVTEWFLVPCGTGLQLTQFNNPTENENKKYDNSTHKKIN